LFSQVDDKITECVVIIGKSSKLDFILKEFDAYMAKDSIIYMVGGKGDVVPELENLKAVQLPGKQNSSEVLAGLFELAPCPTSFIVISNEELPHSDADAKTIATVLLLHHLRTTRFNESKVRVICEILDSSSKDLLDKDVGCEFVLSSEITSRLIAQIAIDGNLRVVFDELFSPEGNEFYLKKPRFYCRNEKGPVPWLHIQAQARAAREVAIGFFTKEGKSILNPSQDLVREYSNDDRIICIAQDDSEFEFVD
jgi:hypothetical protein